MNSEESVIEYTGSSWLVISVEMHLYNAGEVVDVLKRMEGLSLEQALDEIKESIRRYVLAHEEKDDDNT